VRYTIGLWRRRWFILGLAWLFALAAWVVLALLPDKYESTAQIHLNTDTLLNTELSESATAADFEQRVRIMRRALLTPENLEQVIYETGMIADLPTQVDIERRIEGLEEQIVVTPREEQYFHISYWDEDAKMAQKVVSSIVGLLIKQDIGSAQTDGEISLQRFQAELVEIERQLVEKDKEIADFESANFEQLYGVEKAKQQLDVRQRDLVTTQNQLAIAQRRRSSLRTELASIPPVLPSKELLDLRSTLTRLQAVYFDNHPDIITLKARIADMETSPEWAPPNPEYTRMQASITALTDEIAVFQQSQRNLEAEIDALISTAAKQPAAQAQLQEIMRGRSELDLQRSELQQSINKIRVTKNINEGGGTIQYTIFEAPKEAQEPGNPPRGLLTLLGLIAALGAAGGIAFLLAQVDRTYTQPADLEEALGLPVLGAVSPAISPKYRQRRFFERAALVCLFGVLVAAAIAQYWYYEIRIAPESPPVNVASTSGVEGGLR
jgi:polysaccharide chain length determinant protein (PEP-CTERM system associated)